MGNFATTANNAISELKKIKKDSLHFNAPIYFAIWENDTIEYSNLWYILDNASIAAVILPYSYTVITATDSSAFILFIDKNGLCTDSIEIDGWNLRFDTPSESSYRTYHRFATISNGIHEITLQTAHGRLTPNDFKRIWKYFKLISTIKEDYVSLHLIAELYNNDVTIENLNRETIRKEYERYATTALLKANEELLKNIKEIVKSNK